MSNAAVTAEPKSKKKAEVSPEPVAPVASQFTAEGIKGAPAGLPLFLGIGLQRKLAVGAVDDPLEHEADQVAERVMRSIDRSGGPVAIRRKADSNGNGSGGAASHRENASEAPAIVHEALRSPGQPLDAPVRAQMESRFGRDFGNVRVHTDPLAAKSANAVNALAYSAGANLVFAAGRYAPQTRAGSSLLAHELVHTIQQGGTGKLIQRQPNTEIPTSSGTALSEPPETLNTAHDWLDNHGAQLVMEVTTRLASSPLVLPIPQMTWRTGQDAFAGVLMAPLGSDAGAVWPLLPSYIQPDSLVDAVNIGRDCFPSILGSPRWRPGVASEVGRRVNLRLVESLPRVSPRVARHRALAWNPLVPISYLPSLTSLTEASSAPLSGSPAPLSGPIISFTPPMLTSGIAFSYPIDPFVYTALRQTINLDAPAYRAAHPEEFTAEAAAADQRPLRRVQFQFLVGEGLPSWIRVTSPYDATTEEVANTLYGDPTAASQLTAAPPMFGLPARDVGFDPLNRPQGDWMIINGAGRVVPPGPPEVRPRLLWSTNWHCKMRSASTESTPTLWRAAQGRNGRSSRLPWGIRLHCRRLPASCPHREPVVT